MTTGYRQVRVSDVQIGDLLSTTQTPESNTENEFLVVLDLQPCVMTRGSYRDNPTAGMKIFFMHTRTQKKFNATYAMHLMMQMYRQNTAE